MSAKYGEEDYVKLHRWVSDKEVLEELARAMFSHRKYCGFEVEAMFAHPANPMLVTFTCKKPVDERAADDLPGVPARPEDLWRPERGEP